MFTFKLKMNKLFSYINYNIFNFIIITCKDGD